MGNVAPGAQATQTGVVQLVERKNTKINRIEGLSMLRITEVHSGNGHVSLRLEGRIVGPWVDELKIACEQSLARKQTIKLDLAEVTYLDRNGVELLRKFKNQNIRLERCSPFVTQELKEIR